MASFCRRCPDAGAITLPAGVTLRRSEMTAGYYGIRYGYSPRKTRLLRMKFTVVVAAGDGGSRRIMEKVGPCNYAVEDGSVGNDDVAGRSGNKAAEVAVAAAATVVMGVGNRVLYKLALVPLKQYPFFLAQLSTFGYFIHFSFFSFCNVTSVSDTGYIFHQKCRCYRVANTLFIFLESTDIII